MNCYLQFHGIPQTEKDLLSKVNAIATKIQLPQLSGDDVDVIQHHSRIRFLMLSAASQSKKTWDLWWANRRKITNEDGNMHVLENLTKRKRELLKKTKDWAKEHCNKYVWHSNGKVLVRKSDAVVQQSK